MVSALCLMTELLFLHTIFVINPGTDFDKLSHLLIVIQSAAILYDFSHSGALARYKLQLTIGYLWRVFLFYFDLFGTSIYTLPNSGADSAGFFNGAVRVAQGASSARTMLPVVMGHIYRYIGISRIYGQYLLLLCSVVTLCAFAFILNLLDIADEVKTRTLCIAAVLPNFAILSVIYLRESIVTMFVSLSLFFFVLWINTEWEFYFLGAFLCTFAGAVFHSGVVSMALGYLLVRLLYDKRRKSIHISFPNLVAVMILSFLFVYLYLTYEPLLFGKLMGIENLSDIATVNERGGSSYAAYVGNSDTVWNLIKYSLPRMFYFSFSPFPWQWRGISDIIAFMFSSVFYLLSIFEAIKAVLLKRKNYTTVLLLLFVFAAMDFVFGWGTSNVGTAARHRDKMVILFAALWSLSHDGRKDRYIKIGGHTVF